MFDDRWRPEGMEFGACEACHQGTRDMDAVVAVVSRIRGNTASPNFGEELKHHLGALIRRNPHLLLHLEIESAPIMYNGALGHATHIGPDSPLHRVMDAFAARVALAIFRATQGIPAPASARIMCRWDTNVGLDNDEALEEFLQAMGLPRTLVQGRKHVAEQFRFWSATAADEPGLFGCFAAFRDAFGVIAFIDTKETEPLFEPMYQPGFLQDFAV